MPNARTLPEATEPASEHADFARIQSFGRAYARWLKARTQLEVPDSEDEEFVLGTFLEERAALRELFLVPAACSETIWAKLAAFESDLVRERIVGEPKESILLFGLGSIKADLMNLGIARGDI
jgi:hypothetical protein